MNFVVDWIIFDQNQRICNRNPQRNGKIREKIPVSKKKKNSQNSISQHDRSIKTTKKHPKTTLEKKKTSMSATRVRWKKIMKKKNLRTNKNSNWQSKTALTQSSDPMTFCSVVCLIYDWMHHKSHIHCGATASRLRICWLLVSFGSPNEKNQKQFQYACFNVYVLVDVIFDCWNSLISCDVLFCFVLFDFVLVWH